MSRTSVEASILKEIEIDDEEDGVRAIENLVSLANGRIDWSKEDEFQTGLLNRSAEATFPIFEICMRSLNPTDLLRTAFVTSFFQHSPKDSNGCTVLHAAANTGDEDKVALCVELQPALRAVADRTGALPLHWASRNGASSAILSYLIGNDENAGNVLNAVDASGWSALHFAVYNSRVDVVKWLLQAGCATHIPDKQGRAALDLAEQRENPIILDILQQAARNAN